MGNCPPKKEKENIEKFARGLKKEGKNGKEMAKHIVGSFARDKREG